MIRLDFPNAETSITLIKSDNIIYIYTTFGTYCCTKNEIVEYRLIRTLDGASFSFLLADNNHNNFISCIEMWNWKYFKLILEFDDYARIVEQLKRWKYSQ